jgi:hypothetical protein
VTKGLPFTRTREFDADFHMVINAAEDILSWMGFEVRYRNPRTGRLFCHGARGRTGATGYFQVSVTEGPEVVTLLAKADSYNLWSDRKFNNTIDWFVFHLESQFSKIPDQHPKVGRTLGTSGHFEFTPQSEPRTTLTLDPPPRSKPLLWTLVPVIVMLGMASFQVETTEDILLILGFVSPFILAASLMAVGLFRTGGAICMVFSIFMGIAFGLVGWVLVFASGEYAAQIAMVVGRWSILYKIADGEKDELGKKR